MRTRQVMIVAAVFLILGWAGSATAGWVTSGNNMYSDVSGNVGIGTTTPAWKLHLKGGTLWINEGPDKGGIVTTQGNDTTGNDPYLRLWVENNVACVSSWENDFGARILSLAPAGGNVGIGTKNPLERLDVAGNIRVNNGSADGARIVWKGGSGGTKEYRARVGGGGELGFFPGEGKPYALALTEKGHVEIGAAPGEDRGNLIFRTSAGVEVGRIWTDELAVRIHAGFNSAYLSIYDGKIEINRPDTGEPVIALGQGLDYSEGFDLSETDKPTAGTVLRIDPEHPEQLAVSQEPYDKKVAGIVAGAKGLGSGVRLGSNDLDANVALAGRVYCNVNATEAAVDLGDLLTTSSTPGYAMKAVDHARAQGAILGKAMQKLDKGQKGQILVLVTLQ